MTERFDIAIIGAGSGGLSVAAGAAQMGARVVLFEAADMGGDCLNVGCVPSKSLIAAAERAHVMRESSIFGVDASNVAVDFARSMAHVQEVIANIAPHDSVDRFEGFGVTVVRAAARLTGKRTLQADGRAFRAKRIVIASGSRPAVPPVDGLADVPYLTNETIWDLRERPRHLVIMGGGPIGCEMAQAFRRLGADVTIVDMAKIMTKDEPEHADIIRRTLAAEGIVIHEDTTIRGVRRTDGGVALDFLRGGGAEGSHLLVATGRQPNVDDLGLDAAGVSVGKRGIEVDARLKTSNRGIYAIGDCREGPQFTHAAGYDAGIVIRNILFRLPAKADYSALPWVTYTDPELAHVGMTEAEAREAHKNVETYKWSFEENDRAQAERRTEGRAKLVLAGGRIAGCSIAGKGAGDLIHPWALAMSAGVKPRAMAGFIAPYPTLGEVSKRLASSIYTEKLFSGATRRLVRLLLKLP